MILHETIIPSLKERGVVYPQTEREGWREHLSFGEGNSPAGYFFLMLLCKDVWMQLLRKRKPSGGLWKLLYVLTQPGLKRATWHRKMTRMASST